MEWLALLIPFITAIVLFVFFRHKTLWWEFIIPLGISLILIIVLKLSIQTSQVSDTEYWGGWVVKAEYYEDWDETVPCRHPRYRTETDSDGNTHTVFDGYEHIYDVDYHPPYWRIVDSNNEIMHIKDNQFKQLCNKFKNNTKIDLHRHYHLNDGDKWETIWRGEDETLEPVVTSHSYINRIQNANSVFNFRKIKKEEIKQYQLFSYPKIYDYYKCDSIFGDGGETQIEANKLLNLYNAKMGKSKEVRMMILIFKNQSLEAGFLQESYWKRGNKNEFIVTIGIDSGYKIDWTHVFSWTKSEKLITDIKNFINERQDKELNLVEIVKYIVPQVNSQFERRQFKEFNYIRVELPTWSIWMIYITTLLVNGGISTWIVLNEFEENSGKINFF